MDKVNVSIKIEGDAESLLDASQFIKDFAEKLEIGEKKVAYENKAKAEEVKGRLKGKNHD